MSNPQRVVLPLLCLAVSGCSLLGGALPGVGGIGGPKVPPVYGPYAVRGDLIAIGLGDRETRIQTSLDVPPDRGTIHIGIQGHGSNYDSAAAQMQNVFADLKKIGSTGGCGFRISSYVPPNSSDNLKWFTGGSAEIWADVTGKDQDARITQANTCFKALREYLMGRPKYDKGTESGADVTQGSIGVLEVWSVEKLDKYRDELVTLANERLKAVEKANSKMWDHADMQCTSSGIVTVAQSSSHSVTLQLEMLCPVSPAETGSAPGTTRIPGK